MYIVYKCEMCLYIFLSSYLAIERQTRSLCSLGNIFSSVCAEKAIRLDVKQMSAQ